MKGLEKELNRIESEMESKRTKRTRDSDEFKVVESVIDPPTLKVLYKLLNRGTLKAVHGTISAGKEANVYRGENKEGLPVAVKIYRVSTAESDYMMDYIVGDPRFKKVSRSSRRLIATWASKEFKNLKRYHESGIRVPVPIDIERNVLVMEFIGDQENALPAPLLKTVELENPAEVFDEIIAIIEKGYCEAGLVHADLSEFNILWFDVPVIIDVSQAVLKSHPNAEKYLFRDIQNITRYFSKIDVSTEDPRVIKDYILSSGEK